MRTIVIGGGILGLTAAQRLAQSGVEVTVLERDTDPGGLCSGFLLRDRYFEKYHHFVTTADSRLISLMTELSLFDSLEWAPAKTANLTKDALIPFNSPFDLIRYPGIPIKEKLRFGIAVSLLTRFIDWRPFEEISVVEWIIDKGGPAIYDKLWRRLFETKFGERAGEIPVSWFWARLRRRMSKKIKGKDVFGIINGSMKIVTDRLVSEIENRAGRVITGNAVRTIERTGDLLTVKTEQGDVFTADKVIFTASLDALVETVPSLPEKFITQCKAIEYSGIVNAVFELKRPLSEYFWINGTEGDLPFSGIIEITKLYEEPKTNLIYLPRYFSSDHLAFEENSEKILDDYQDGLLHTFPKLNPDEILSRHLFRERFADPYYSLNYSKKIVDHKTPIDGLFCYNTAQIYPITRSADSSVLFGENAAKAVLEGH